MALDRKVRCTYPAGAREPMKRIIVCGNRDMTDKETVKTVLNAIYREEGIYVTIVHGGCPTGADAFADEHARFLGFTVEVHPANWKKFGRRAGPLRNEHIAGLGAEYGVAFWNGKSSGTGGMIGLCAAYGILVWVHPHVIAPPKLRVGI